MTLPVTGPLKMSAINAELKFVPIARTNLGSLTVRNLAKKTTGPIKFSDLFGKSSRILSTKIFYTSGTWTAPMSTNKLITLAGWGGAGSPGYTQFDGYTMVAKTETSAFRPPYPSIYTEVIATSYSYSATTADAPVPASSAYSYYTQTGGTTIETTQPYYRYVSTTYSKRTDYTTVPAQFGGNSTAFGKTFNGGYAGTVPATVSFTDVPVVPGTTYSITVPSGGRVTFTYEEDTPTFTIISGTFTGTGSLTIPANTTVTLIGNGAAGGSVYNPGQPYIAPTVTTQQNQHGRNEAQGLNAPYPCTDTPGSTGPTNVTFTTYGTTKYVFWDCPTTTSTGGQPYIPEGYSYTTGASATANLNGVTKTFVGGTGGAATAVTTTLTSGTATQVLSYTVPSGGSLNYSYLVPI